MGSITYKIALSSLLVVFTFGRIFSQDIESSYPVSFILEVQNPLNECRIDAMLLIPEENIFKRYPHFNPRAFVVTSLGKEIPSQYNQHDADHKGIVLVLDSIKANETAQIRVHYNKNGKDLPAYQKRTQAEISHKVDGGFENRKYIGGSFKNTKLLDLPTEHTDHSNFIRYEGPGWESDKVGYRFYLDWRNAVDVFGKKTPHLVLQDVGQDGFSSYHEMSPWGMDVLKVGESLGIGSIAYLEGGKARRIDEVDSTVIVISENGPLYSSIATDYYGWKVDPVLDIKSNISIHAGSRLTNQIIHMKGNGANLCTGIGKDENAKILNSNGDKNEMGYLASYGVQSLNSDKLGLAIFFSSSDFIEFTDDEFSHIVKLRESNGRVQYYYLAAWELEPGGIADQASFTAYVEKAAKELANPLKVSFLVHE